MRYSVKYEGRDKNWVVTDTVTAHQVIGIHSTKSEAYKQAFAEQELWRKHDPVAKHLARVRRMLPRSLATG
ncbi:MAG: hypothetical protein HQ503_13995 [Rhodospirillales bacterium]|nr:hypothetical protein [Rhodospirillales bacterium]